MSHNLVHRSISFSLAAVVTLAMLGSIDRLAQRDDHAAGWARNAPQAVMAAAQA